MRRTLLLLAAAPLLAACGAAPHPQLARTDAAGLIALADRVASEGACGQARDIPKLHARAIALVNARRVPAALQEPLLSGVNALAAVQPVCLPSVPASTATPTVTAATPARRPAPHGHGPKHHPGPKGHHGHGHGR